MCECVCGVRVCLGKVRMGVCVCECVCVCGVEGDCDGVCVCVCVCGNVLLCVVCCGVYVVGTIVYDIICGLY